jgi:signal transduction histidine kinase
MPEPKLFTGATGLAAQDEIVRLNKIIAALVDRAERSTSARSSDFSLFQTTIQLEDQVRLRTEKLESALRENEKITHTLQQANLQLEREIRERTRAEAEREKIHRELLEVSRQAGMAEIATGVLHNVGNVLNSVNVSATLIAEALGKSRVGLLGKATALLHEHAADPGAFLAGDPRGRQLPAYLTLLAEQLVQERRSLQTEVESLRRNIEHIKDIVSMQQSYARVSGVREKVSVAELVDDTLRMNSAALARHDVEIITDYAPQGPEIVTERQKVLQILLNLVRNAKYACADAGRKGRRIIVRVTPLERTVQIAVIDNGVGIAPENLDRIFSHGFTTRKDGHGFGLHSGALAARELGGELNAYSDGIGQGATFVLTLPRQRA